MRFVGSEEERSSARERDHVEEEDTEAADISGVELVQMTHQSLFPTQRCIAEPPIMDTPNRKKNLSIKDT